MRIHLFGGESRASPDSPPPSRFRLLAYLIANGRDVTTYQWSLAGALVTASRWIDGVLAETRRIPLWKVSRHLNPDDIVFTTVSLWFSLRRFVYAHVPRDRRIQWLEQTTVQPTKGTSLAKYARERFLHSVIRKSDRVLASNSEVAQFVRSLNPGGWVQHVADGESTAQNLRYILSEFQIPISSEGLRDFGPDQSRTDAAQRDRGDAQSPMSVIILPPIPWTFMRQRVHHFALHLAQQGVRVAYVSPVINRGPQPHARIMMALPEGIELATLEVPEPDASVFDPPANIEIQAAVRKALSSLKTKVDAKVALVAWPGWHRFLTGMSGIRILYDCHDYLAGFSHVRPAIIEDEKALIASCDWISISAKGLSSFLGSRNDFTLIRNGVQFSTFGSVEDLPSQTSGHRPQILYFGAVYEWFDVAVCLKVAGAYPQADLLIAGPSRPDVAKRLAAAHNIHLMGPVPYPELAGLLATASVCIIPFILNDLIRYTDPIKVYEYFAAGRPVVSTALPELEHIPSDLLHIARNHDEFVTFVGENLRRSDPELATKRRNWAKEQTWACRGELLFSLIKRLHGLETERSPARAKPPARD